MVRHLLKWTAVAGKTPAAADLVQREMAVNTTDSLLYMLNTAGQVVCLNPLAEPLYNMGMIYRSGMIARCSGQQVTDSNGRVTIYLTKDGTSTGPAIFSRILSKQGTATATSTSSALQCPFVVVESVTAKSVVFRCIVGATTLVLGATVAYAGAGYTVDFDVQGLT